MFTHFDQTMRNVKQNVPKSIRHKKLLCVVVMVLSLFEVKAQHDPILIDALKNFGFTEHKIISAPDTIVYYLRNYTSRPNKLVLYIQGTDPFPVFFYQMREGQPKLIKWFNDDHKTLDSDYAYAIVAKPGLSGIFNKDHFTVPDVYHKNNYRQYRVNQIHLAIEDIKKHHLRAPEKIIVYGHSEGAQIAAALCRINKSVTHLGFWSGNVLNNFYEFALFERISVLRGQQTDSMAHAHIEGLLAWYKNVIDNPTSTNADDWGYTNKRWSSYEEAPINDLLGIDIPIFAVFATKDESTPIETAYLLPIQFMQKRKTNLTFKVCMDCDHCYRQLKNGTTINRWDSLFAEFIEWAK